MIAKDFLGNIIDDGDYVVYTELKYRNFLIGVVVKITEKTLQIKPLNKKIKTYTSSRIIKQFHQQVLKIDPSQIPESYTLT